MQYNGSVSGMTTPTINEPLLEDKIIHIKLCKLGYIIEIDIWYYFSDMNMNDGYDAISTYNNQDS